MQYKIFGQDGGGAKPRRRRRAAGALRRGDAIRYHAHFVFPPLTKRTPMATVSTNEMKSGTKVLIDGEPYSIVDNEYR